MAADDEGPLPAAVVVETISGDSLKVLLDQGQKIATDAAALVEETRVANEREKRHQHRRDIRFGFAIALVIIGVSMAVTIGVLNFRTNASNRDVLTRIDHSQQGIDELVTFVRDLKAQPPNTSTSDAVAKILSVLCASSDPVRVEECAALQQPPGG